MVDWCTAECQVKILAPQLLVSFGDLQELSRKKLAAARTRQDGRPTRTDSQRSNCSNKNYARLWSQQTNLTPERRKTSGNADTTIETDTFERRHFQPERDALC